MGTFSYPLRISSMDGQQPRHVQATVDTGAAYTTLPGSLLRNIGVEPVGKRRFLLADGRRVPREQGWAIIRLEGQQFPTPVAFGEEGEPTLLGAMALEHALLAVDPHGQRLIPVDALEMPSTGERAVQLSPPPQGEG